jgi:hypothetical protein
VKRQAGDERRRLAMLPAAAAFLVIAGCDHSPGRQPSTPAPSTPAAAMSSTANDAAERAAVETAYRTYWAVSETFDQQYPESSWPSVLGRVAVDPQLSLVLANTRTQRRIGIRLYGHVVPRPVVTRVSGTGTASVQDCQDASKSGQLDARTGKPRTVGVARNPVTAVLRRGSDGQWRVASISYPAGAC